MREPAWRREGEEPDYRFSLANERTFLAWMRTALALLAGGVVLDQFVPRLRDAALARLLTPALCVLAALLALQAYAHWRDNEIAMRHRQRLPASRLLPLLTGGVFGAALALGGLFLAGHH